MAMERENCKKFALEKAGEFFNFREGGKTLVGKLVGYYPALALLVMELPKPPPNPIDPIQSFLEGNGILLTKGYFYTYASMDSIINADSNYIDAKRFPNSCPRCKSSAYVGVVPNSVECSNVSCISYKV
jgi:hypothetical protein